MLSGADRKGDQRGDLGNSNVGAAAEGGDLLPAHEATKIMREVFTKLD